MIIARPGPGLQWTNLTSQDGDLHSSKIVNKNMSPSPSSAPSPWEKGKGQFDRQIVLMLIITSYYIYTSIFVTLEFIRYETSWKHLMNFTERKYSFNAPNDQMELSVGEWM